MENPTHEQIAASVHEPPALVEMGEFSTGTLGGPPPDCDSFGGRFL